LRFRQSNEEAASAHPGFPVEKFEPVLTFLFEGKTLELDISLNRTLVSDLHLHLGEALGFSTGPLEVQRHGTGLPFLNPVAFLQQKPKENPHSAMPGGQLKGVDNIEKALELNLSLGRRYDQVTE
jgi:hypothetical protein